MTSSAAICDGIVYVGTSDTHFVGAYDSKGGVQKWIFDTGSNVFSSPLIAGGIVYVASGWAMGGDAPRDHVYALDAQTGEELWSFPIDHPIHSSPSVEDGVLYVTSTDGNLYAID